MVKVRFSKNFDFYPAARKGHVCTAYPAGEKIHSVTRECADRAIEGGYAVEVPEAEKIAPSVAKRKAAKKAAQKNPPNEEVKTEDAEEKDVSW